MARPTRIGRPWCVRPRGFTLVELLLVLVLVALLASIVGPTVTAGLQRSRESTLKHDLRVMRQAIDDYYGDHGRYPAALDALVENRYVRRVPPDPLTGKVDTWVFTQSEEQGDTPSGIRDVHSGAEGQAIDGTSYKDW
jgi:general secretion pathway protein G